MSSTNKLTLILSDIHHRVDQATKIIKHVGADEVIFTGDAFDDFNDTPDMVRATCEWVEWFVSNPNHIMLMGNHEMGYRYTYRSFQCSGYTQWKYFIIHDTLPQAAWDKIKWFHFLDNQWLLTHGGLHKINLPDSIKKFHNDRPKFILEISGYLDHELWQGFQAGATNQSSWIFGAGVARWGTQRVGGITWCDHEREFVPVQGLSRIYGHTPLMTEPSWWIQEKNNIRKVSSSLFTFTNNEKTLNPDNSYNLCLDVCGNTHYAVWNGKKLEIGNYRDL